MRCIQPVLLSALLAASWCLDRAQAGEKILFSTNKKDGGKTDLSVRPDKPALPTLDLTLMGGRASKAEEMAPVGAPPPKIDTRLLKKLKDKDQSDQDWNDNQDKKDKDWQTGDKDDDPTENRTSKKDLEKSGKDRDRNGEKKRGQEMDAKEEKSDKTDRLDPFTASNTNSVDYTLAVPGVSSTNNHSLFNNNNGKDGQTTFLGTRSLFGNKANEEPASRLQTRGFDPELERSATLRLLGIEPRDGSSSAISGNEGSSTSKLFQYSAMDALLGRGNNNQTAQATPGGFGDPLSNQSGSMSGDNARGFSPRDSVFKTGLMSEINTLGLSPSPNPLATQGEPAKIDRSPLILPVPRRKF